MKNVKKSTEVVGGEELIKFKDMLITCEQRDQILRITALRKEFDQLFTACSPDIRDSIHKFYRTASKLDKLMLDKWAVLGAKDFTRAMRPYFTRECTKTCTVFGLACLLAYTQGWLQAAEEWTDELHFACGPKRAPKVRSAPAPQVT